MDDDAKHGRHGASRLERFTWMSGLLLEVEPLRESTARTYLAMLDDLDPDWPLDEMAAELSDRTPIVAQLDARPNWRAAAVSVLQVWYSGSLTRPNGDPVPQPPNAYLDALMWPLLRTEPSGLPGPFFGEWAYPPTRADSPFALGADT